MSKSLVARAAALTKALYSGPFLANSIVACLRENAKDLESRGGGHHYEVRKSNPILLSIAMHPMSLHTHARRNAHTHIRIPAWCAGPS